MSNPVDLFLSNVKKEKAEGQMGAREQAAAQVQQTPQPSSIVTSQNMLRTLLEEVKKLTKIERAILAQEMFGTDDVFRQVTVDDWVKLLEERVGSEYANAFKTWVTIISCGGSNERR
ncbi:hypothetical protein [Vulcanisaeta sp. JCM 16159]|uniref:hypothetical protein n=1 Tax=Vulcanisaeta sp. JCM 16159 TaxID=1295371 RepID=UPI0006D27A76|nr:hypothetical protein [Vulcanisaeta sp. JCM 16159]